MSALRFRLTVTYVILFAVVFASLGIIFQQTLSALHETYLRQTLRDDWMNVRNYLRFEGGEPVWYYDRQNLEESSVVGRIRQVYLLADVNGKVLEIGPEYENLPIETEREVQGSLRKKQHYWTTKRKEDGNTSLVRAGPFEANDNRLYFLAIGRSFAAAHSVTGQFTRSHFLFLPLVLIAVGAAGWFVAGRALMPVNEVALAAQRITGNNLHIQIPPRGSGDELDRLIHAFNRMIKRLETSLTQARQFSTDVSHELRTPLTAIRGQLEVAIMTAKTPAQYREAAANALAEVERLSGVVRSLLLLSQAESGQLSLRRELLNLSHLVAEIVTQFEIPAEAADITLVPEVPENCMYYGDRVQLERLVSNLLSNAVRYTRSRGSVHIRVLDTSAGVELVVEDTGIGIEPQHLPYIFDRFYRVPHASESAEFGVGLGLSFVKWIVDAHGGQIHVDSTPGEGSRFTVLLPREEPQSSLETSSGTSSYSSPAASKS
jgi:heavy metal sensor kinase